LISASLWGARMGGLFSGWRRRSGLQEWSFSGFDMPT